MEVDIGRGLTQKDSFTYIWERTKITGLDPWARYQRVPPARETTDKLMRYFLDIDDTVLQQMKRRHRRSIPKLYAQFDAIFITDSSASILPRDYERTIRALQRLTGKAQPNRRYAAITFSYNATIRFNFTDKRHAMYNLRKIPFEAGKTNTQDALDICRKKLILNRECGALPGLRKRVLVITDGQSNVEKHKTLFRAFQIKITGTQIFVVAVGKYLKGISEIVGLATSTDAHLYRVASGPDDPAVASLEGIHTPLVAKWNVTPSGLSQQHGNGKFIPLTALQKTSFLPRPQNIALAR